MKSSLQIIQILQVWKSILMTRDSINSIHIFRFHSISCPNSLNLIINYHYYHHSRFNSLRQKTLQSNVNQLFASCRERINPCAVRTFFLILKKSNTFLFKSSIMIGLMWVPDVVFGFYLFFIICTDLSLCCFCRIFNIQHPFHFFIFSINSQNCKWILKETLPTGTKSFKLSPEH